MQFKLRHTNCTSFPTHFDKTKQKKEDRKYFFYMMGKGVSDKVGFGVGGGVGRRGEGGRRKMGRQKNSKQNIEESTTVIPKIPQ